MASTINKCVILGRGLGKRMRQDEPHAQLDAAQSAAAATGMKAMVPVGRPFLDYVLSALADAGFGQVCLVIGPEHGAVREYYGRTSPPRRIRVAFAIQEEALGTANAVVAAERFAGVDEFAVLNSDNYYSADALDGIQQLGQPGTVLFDAASLVRNSNIPEDRVRAFASCAVNGQGILADIVEKPEKAFAGTDKLVSMNLWRFGPEIFSVCRDVARSPRGEYELPIAVRLGIQRGMRLRTVISYSGVLDLSRRADIAAVAERLKDVRVSL